MLGAVARAINRIPSFKIPDWVPLIGGNTYSLPYIPTPSFPRIPTLHTGTEYFMPPNGAMEGMALLQRGEKVIPAGNNTTSNNNTTYGNVYVNISVKDLREMNDIRDFFARIKQDTRALGGAY